MYDPVPEGGLPPSLHLQQQGPVLTVSLARPHKRNALDDPTVRGLEEVFRRLPEDVGAVVLRAEGAHFSAGLDLTEMRERSAWEGVLHSRMWHRAFDAIESGPVPVVCALRGAVIGGGLELAAACHLRVAEPSAYFALPEGSRGLFVGGGGSVRIPRLIGAARMTDLMLTGRRLDAEEAERYGLVHYLVEDGQGAAEAERLAHRIAENAPMSNFAVLQALPRIARMAPDEGLLTESLAAAIAQSTDEAKQRMADFLEGRGPKVRGR